MVAKDFGQTGNGDLAGVAVIAGAVGDVEEISGVGGACKRQKTSYKKRESQFVNTMRRGRSFPILSFLGTENNQSLV